VYKVAYVTQHWKCILTLQGFRVAYVVFEDNRGLQNALKLGKNMEPIILYNEKTTITCGLQSKYVVLCSLHQQSV
jgi:hypothetical protein